MGLYVCIAPIAKGDSMGRLRTTSTSAIVEAIKPSEYQALNDTQKDYLRLIISCGTFNAADGSRIRAALLSMFGEGTTTRIKLLDMMGVELPIKEE